jgi:DNA-binding protein H-NS
LLNSLLNSNRRRRDLRVLKGRYPTNLLLKENHMARSPQHKPAHEAPPPLKLSIYSFDELLEIKRNVDIEVKSRQAKEAEQLRAKVTEAAQALGISVEELLRLPAASRQRRTRQTRHARGKQPARYRGPGGEEWSGRGPAPRWMKPYLAKGKTKADFLISK